MIIAHVVSSLAIGGQEKMILDLAAGQSALGHQVMVVSLAPGDDPGPLGPAFEEKGVAVRHAAKKSGVDVGLGVRLAALFRRQRCDVVHAHNRMALLYAAAPGKLAGATTVYTRHGPGVGSGAQRWFRRVAARFLDAYVAVSPEMLALSRQQGDCDEKKLSAINNGVDLRRFHPDADARSRARAALGIPQTAWVIGTVGRLAPEKAYDRLIAAAAPLLGDEARLVIVGDGAEAARLRAAIVEARVEPFVHLTGKRDDVAHLLCAFDVFALSSKMEGLPLVILEAMATELPIVSTAVGGIPGAVADGETGLLSPPGDAPALRERLLALADDRPRARRLGQRGRQIALDRYSGERMVNDYLALYRRFERAK
ncbi:MAG TPA: glycosyltransferase [Polyangia bacterium]|jgi:glycosyltransferase involved in cell wall biosynthesis